jgi:hypothetical protein
MAPLRVACAGGQASWVAAILPAISARHSSIIFGTSLT